MNIQSSYFSIGNPIVAVDRWFNPFHYIETVSMEGNDLDIIWTNRADNILALREAPLIVEMQLYFSCVVKKRLIYHDHYAGDSIIVSDKLRVAFRPVEALSCDPVEFANNYPVKREFTSRNAIQMHPSKLELDYRRGSWQGMFTI